MPNPSPIGINTYCLRAFRWTDAQLLDYASSLKLDAVFLQDSLDPKAQEPAHWLEVKEQAARLGLRRGNGRRRVLPKIAGGTARTRRLHARADQERLRWGRHWRGL